MKTSIQTSDMWMRWALSCDSTDCRAMSRWASAISICCFAESWASRSPSALRTCSRLRSMSTASWHIR